MKKRITLKKITLRDWRSLNLEIDFNNSITNISGKNGIGKSSIQFAWNWLWSSYTNATSLRNHELFDNRYELTHETPIASVKALIDIDGVEYMIEKTAQAKFSRKRSSNEYTKDSSDTYKMYIDNIETSSTDFTAWIERNVCPIESILFVLDGTFFATLAENDKKKARKVLENIVGEIKDSDLKGDYTCLQDDLSKGYSIEQIEEKTKNTIKPLKDRMDKIPALIDDKEQTISEYSQIDYNSILKDCDDRKREIANIDATILGNADAIQPIIEKRNEILDAILCKEKELAKQKNEYEIQIFNKKNEIKNKIRDVELQNNRIASNNKEREQEYHLNEIKLDGLKSSLKNLERCRENLLKQRDDVKGRFFDGSGVCSVCKQPLPYEMQEDALRRFNETKQMDLESIVNRGKEVRLQIDALKLQISELEKTIASGFNRNDLISCTELELELKQYQDSVIPYEQTIQYSEIQNEIKKLHLDIPTMPTNDNDSLTIRKNELINELESLNRKYGLKDKLDALKRDVDALKVEKRELATDIAKLEGVIEKCKEYKNEKADIVSWRINHKLRECKIDMWETLKNGELTPSCIITSLDGIKYSTLNNSKRIKTCISLQEMFCEHFNIEMPTFVDESSVFDNENLPRMNRQAIYLFASDDKQLVVK